MLEMARTLTACPDDPWNDPDAIEREALRRAQEGIPEDRKIGAEIARQIIAMLDERIKRATMPRPRKP